MARWKRLQGRLRVAYASGVLGVTTSANPLSCDASDKENVLRWPRSLVV